jgi:hypothetical protein
VQINNIVLNIDNRTIDADYITFTTTPSECITINIINVELDLIVTNSQRLEFIKIIELIIQLNIIPNHITVSAIACNDDKLELLSYVVKLSSVSKVAIALVIDNNNTLLSICF